MDLQTLTLIERLLGYADKYQKELIDLIAVIRGENSPDAHAAWVALHNLAMLHTTCAKRALEEIDKAEKADRAERQSGAQEGR